MTKNTLMFQKKKSNAEGFASRTSLASGGVQDATFEGNFLIKRLIRIFWYL